jgi:hypothetical protein
MDIKIASKKITNSRIGYQMKENIIIKVENTIPEIRENPLSNE